MAKPLLPELKFFVNCVSTNYRNLPADVSAQLVKCSLHLLEHLPASREAVLEYFASVFDVSVKNYIQFIEKEPNGTAPEDETIADIQDALERLVTNGPPSWAPLISSWSLCILGSLSNKFSGGRPMDIGSSCTRWLGSNAMRCLLGLAASCFGKLNSAETEDCIAILLSTYVQNSPHFDWVVARLGGCFPLKVISKILQCGLKGFVGNYNSTLDSEVGILAYLSFAHESELKFALKEMLEAVLLPSPTNGQPQPNTVPYLMHLSSMSEILLQPIVQVFLELFDESLIPTIVGQSKHWPSNFNPRDIQPTLSSLALKLKSNVAPTILMLARIASDHTWCQEFLENILQELESLLLVSDSSTCPLLTDLLRDESSAPLCQACCSANLIEQQTAVRLLLLAGTHSPLIYHQTVAQLMTRCYATDRNGLGALVRFVAVPLGAADALQVGPAIELALDELFVHTKPRWGADDDDTEVDLHVLTNLRTLIRLEQQRGADHSDVSRTAVNCVDKILDIWSSYLQQEMRYVESTDVRGIHEPKECLPSDVKRQKLDDEFTQGDEENCRQSRNCTQQIHILAEVLDLLEIGGREPKMKFCNLIRFAQQTVRYFFWSLVETDTTIRTTATHRAYQMLARQSAAQKASRTIAIRELLDGALFMYGNLFGAHTEHNYLENSDRRRDSELLLKINQKQGNAPSAIRSILHAGIIGQGLKVPTKHASKPDPELQNAFLNALSACCRSSDNTLTIDGFSTVSLLLVEMVSTDVMYNGLPWPEEDLINKVTMERDLQIRRTFSNAPILWAILGLIATHRPAICYSSVLLRAICASVLHQWRAKSMDKFQQTAHNAELFEVTYKMLEVMSLGQLLPAPMNFVHTVIEFLDPAEIAIVLKECVWNYMRENVPAPALYTVDPATGLHWRPTNSARPAPQFLDPLRNIMQGKLPTLGAFYHHMFVMPELSANLATQMVVVEPASTITTDA